MFLVALIITNLLYATADVATDTGYCDISTGCHNEVENTEKLLFYDVNPPEGFNLRRDVYMRFAIMLTEAQKRGKKLKWRLVLPPWCNLYHWKSESRNQNPLAWSHFFDITSLKSYAPVLEMHEVFSQTKSKTLVIDVLYVLQNYEDPFENGYFEDKWETVEDCHYKSEYWGYSNITAKEIVCVKFQGKISMLWELISLHPAHNKVMFAFGEIPLHDTYGTKPYWDCRKSMRFNNKLVSIASNYITKNLYCNTVKCKTYISVHWRRQDFVRYRSNDVPSPQGTVQQLDKILHDKFPEINNIFIASDASKTEMDSLRKQLEHLNYKVHSYSPSTQEIDELNEGGVAIVDQIICSRAEYFIGTHESTFSFRVQEEREILGYESSSTFNRLCPDKGPCEKPSSWTIVE